jgi:hypothetical protein
MVIRLHSAAHGDDGDVVEMTGEEDPAFDGLELSMVSNSQEKQCWLYTRVVLRATERIVPPQPTNRNRKEAQHKLQRFEILGLFYKNLLSLLVFLAQNQNRLSQGLRAKG